MIKPFIVNSSETFVDARASFNLTKEPVRRRSEPSTHSICLNLLSTAYGDYCSSRRQKPVEFETVGKKWTIWILSLYMENFLPKFSHLKFPSTKSFLTSLPTPLLAREPLKVWNFFDNFVCQCFNLLIILYSSFKWTEGGNRRWHWCAGQSLVLQNCFQFLENTKQWTFGKWFI
jgi:hypothetical protein